jgi:hypothetical protein
MFITAGSSIGAPDFPMWCNTQAFIGTSQFPWNVPTTAYISAPAKSNFYMYVGATADASYMANDEDMGIAYPLCES